MRVTALLPSDSWLADERSPMTQPGNRAQVILFGVQLVPQATGWWVWVQAALDMLEAGWNARTTTS
jgi:hypothetical protein